MRWMWAGMVLLLLMPGCAGAFRVVVDPTVLGQTDLAWVETRHPGEVKPFGVSSTETDYVHQAQDPPPFSGVLQVFSLKGDKRDPDTLLDWARQAVANATQANQIEVDDAKTFSGTRTLKSGLNTQYFVLEGRVTASGFPFARDAKLRILGEAGHDGRSATSFVVVGLAQVGVQTQCPILGPCQSTTDMRTWNELAGDPNGLVGGARSATGLVYHLVSHG